MTRSIFKLEHRSKTQNVASSMANVSVWLVYQYIEKSLKLQMAAILKIFKALR